MNHLEFQIEDFTILSLEYVEKQEEIRVYDLTWNDIKNQTK